MQEIAGIHIKAGRTVYAYGLQQGGGVGGGTGKRLQGFGLSTWKSEVEEGKTAGVDPDGRLGAQFLTS